MALSPRLQRAIEKHERLGIGLISGTSIDAAEAALCRIAGSGASAKVELVAHVSLPFPKKLVQRVLGVDSSAAVCELNFELGEWFARAALQVAEKAGTSTDEIDFIGSHGQTIAHLPKALSSTPSTLQIGEAAVIAERTGIPTVCDFRTRDIAAGGEGAPLVPYADWVLFRKAGAHRAFQNLGGIANLSVVGDRLEQTVAFDSGPGNMLLDGIARRATNGRLSYDKDGTLSRKGTVLEPLLAELLRHPFLKQKPPRSAGREQFGEVLVQKLWARYRRKPYDLLATAAAFTVEATARAYEKWVLPRFSLEGIYVSGGGSRNPTLMKGLAERLPVPAHPLDRLGFPEAAKEAACFALLASECLSNTPQNIPAVTGARRAVVLGKIVA
jgi:anhydro-N-acetylmuramic acid kinase